MRATFSTAVVTAAAACASPLPSAAGNSDPAACSAQPSLAADAGTHALKTVFVIVLENKAWSEIEGNPAAPYMNGTLLPQFAHATDYRNGGLDHSLPAYVELEAGDPLGITQDATPAEAQLGTCHLTTWLEETGISWRAYAEGITGTQCPIDDDGRYAVRHDPFVYFTDVAGSPPSAASARCIEHVRPYSELARDLQAGTVARYNFITPDLCHSGHDTCAPANDPIRQQDDWLAAEIPVIQASQAWQQGGVILIVWDEGNGTDPPVGLIAVSPVAKPGHAGTVPYSSHATTVRTVQEILGLRPFLRRAATAQGLSDLFAPYP
jgi:hypothetical protein